MLLEVMKGENFDVILQDAVLSFQNGSLILRNGVLKRLLQKDWLGYDVTTFLFMHGMIVFSSS